MTGEGRQRSSRACIAGHDRPGGRCDIRTTLTALSGILLAAIVGGCGLLERAKPAPQSESERQADLRMGYSMLADTLSDESGLKTLEFFKKITLDSPSQQVGEIVDKIDATSEKQSAQLEKLRRLSPDVSGTPPSSSPVGDAIRAVAKELGKDEMLSREKDFDTRFLVLQAQATRMVAAMAKAIARFDPNENRVKWLLALSSQYEGIRDDLIDAIAKRGAAKSGGGE